MRALGLSSIIPKRCWYCGILVMFGSQGTIKGHKNLSPISRCLTQNTEAQRLWCVFEMAAFAWAHRLGYAVMVVKQRRACWLKHFNRNDLKNRVEIRPVIFAPVPRHPSTSGANLLMPIFFGCQEKSLLE